MPFPSKKDLEARRAIREGTRLAKLLGLSHDDALWMHEANEARGTAHDATWVQMVVRLCRERGIDTAKPKPAVAAPLRRRFLVLQRDGFRCRYCGAAPNFAHLHVDHAISMRDGGSDEMDNLVTSCRECNLGKGKLSVPVRAA